MYLGELKLPISYEEAKSLALCFPEQLSIRLSELQSLYGTELCVLKPIKLIDGRMMLSADVLTEISKGRFFSSMWEAADKKILFDQVEVIPWELAITLIDIGEYPHD